MPHHHDWLDLYTEADGSLVQYCACGAERTLKSAKEDDEEEQSRDG